jgi:adenylate cyclase
MHLLELMNDYLEATSTFLQSQSEAWLEGYVGDMMCYYWPITQKNADVFYLNALKATLQLAKLQKHYFLSLKIKFQNKINSDQLDSINSVIDAGIGLSVGSVIMGDIGPKSGTKKFGILGDPINLAARLESLTRYFNTEIIITSDFIATAKSLGYPTRRLGRFCVKGRQKPETLFSIGYPEDNRFSQINLQLWEQWLIAEEKNNEINPYKCPEIYTQDYLSMQNWKSKGLLIDGIWMMDVK